MIKNIKRILTGERPLIDVWYYIQGNLRYQLYYSKYKWLLRRHIREQIKFRITVMNPECYSRGECIKCGCQTTMLQMANKSCDNRCYPEMMSKKEWKDFKNIKDELYKPQNYV